MPALRRWVLARPRVLLVEAPGSRDLRWAAEADLERRRWPAATSPADTDLLVILGRPGPALSAAVDLLWTQVPQPRHRLLVVDPTHLRHQLDAAIEALFAAAETAEPEQPEAPLLPGGAERAGHDMGGHAGHDMGGHAGHDMHHGGEVAGLAMADTAPDRDGLQLDSLRVSLGPVLPGWPTGLVLRGHLQGDVLTGVEASWVDGEDVSRASARHPAAPRAEALDHLARFMEVAGWPAAARDARRARDALVSGDADPGQADRSAARVAHRITRSWTLAWSVRGTGATTGRDAPATQDDALTRVSHWCEVVSGHADRGLSDVPLDELAALVEGAELATARLVVASVQLEPPAPHVHPGMTHG